MTSRSKNQTAHASRPGFSLVEMLVVLAIVAGLMGAAVYGLNVVTAGNLRDQAMRLTSVMKFTWSRAAIEQVNYRLVIDLDANTYWTEVTDAEVVKQIDPDDEDEARGELEEERQEEANQQNAGASDLFGVESDPFGITRPTSFAKAESAAIEPENFPEGIEIYQVLTTRQERPITSGKVAVSFFPDGFQEPVIIVLKDAHGSFYSLVNEPLTGRINIYSRLIEDREMLQHGEDDE